MPERPDLGLYAATLPLFARNLGVALAPLAGAAIGVGLQYLEGPLFDPVGGALNPIMQLVINIVYGFAFAIAVIFADDAWRHGRGHIGPAWQKARERALSIVVAAVGFLFLIYVAQMIGGFLPIPFLSIVLELLAVWAFIYAIPAAAIGGIPAGAAFSASLQMAKRQPLATAILVAVSLLIWYALTGYALGALIAIPAMSVAALDVMQILLFAIALGLIAVLCAKQYADLAFRPYW